MSLLGPDRRFTTSLVTAGIEAIASAMVKSPVVSVPGATTLPPVRDQPGFPANVLIVSSIDTHGWAEAVQM